MRKALLVLAFLFISGVTAIAQTNSSPAAAKPPYSPSLRTGDLLFISGQIGINPLSKKLAGATFKAEVEQVMANLQTQLKQHGLDLQDLVNTTIYIKDMRQYALLNEVYGSFFKDGYFPTRTTVAILDLPANANVEIAGIAQFSRKK